MGIAQPAGVVALLALRAVVAAHAQPATLVEVDTGRRMDGANGPEPVVQRAILTMPAVPTDTALLFFRGNPGYMLARSVADKRRNLGWIARAEGVVLEAGIALVQVDCPTDQWGDGPRPPATNCLADYRSSPRHADDVRLLLAHLRERHGLSKAYILGHSIGTISSRWLAIHLKPDEIAGTIHSAAINALYPRGHLARVLGHLSMEFPRRSAGAPMLHVHHENDACPVTPHAFVRGYAVDNLVTVRGGTADGDPCGGTHLHSYLDREPHAMRAIVRWIRSGTVDAVAGD